MLIIITTYTHTLTHTHTHHTHTHIHIHTHTHTYTYTHSLTHTHTHTHTHTQVLQLTSDIEGVHHELAMGAERHSDLQQKSGAQLCQLQVSLFYHVGTATCLVWKMFLLLWQQIGW